MVAGLVQVSEGRVAHTQVLLIGKLHKIDGEALLDVVPGAVHVDLASAVRLHVVNASGREMEKRSVDFLII